MAETLPLAVKCEMGKAMQEVSSYMRKEPLGTCTANAKLTYRRTVGPVLIAMV